MCTITSCSTFMDAEVHILLSNKASHPMKVHSGFKHLQTKVFGMHGQACFPLPAPLNQKTMEQCQSPFHYPKAFQVNNPEAHEKSSISLPLQGANILKSKHSKQAETQLKLNLSCFSKQCLANRRRYIKSVSRRHFIFNNQR